jgi:uncharacterized protein YyaL (SSP411 family)
VVLSGEAGHEDFENLRAAVFRSRRLNRVVAHADAAESLADVAPLVASRGSTGAAAQAWVCRNFACLRPTSDPAELAVLLDA